MHDTATMRQGEGAIKDQKINTLCSVSKFIYNWSIVMKTSLHLNQEMVHQSSFHEGMKESDAMHGSDLINLPKFFQSNHSKYFFFLW